MNKPDIFTIRGKRPGPKLAIFAGVHGNETAGVLALKSMLPTLTITRGTLVVAFANPPAIAANVRMITKNLNRCFYAGNIGTDPEDELARQLMAVLDSCDALLDIHMFYDDDGEPFIICEEDALEVAKIFDVAIISTNWTATEPGGTDGYMHLQGKVGICLECGPIAQAAAYQPLAERSIYQFLRYYGMIDTAVSFSKTKKRLISAERAVYKTSTGLRLSEGFRNFDRLTEGQLIARDGQTTFTAKAGQCIIFPHYQARMGEEAYILGKELQERPLTDKVLL